MSEAVTPNTQPGPATEQTSVGSERPPRQHRLSLVIYHDGGSLVVPLLRNGALTVGRTQDADVVVRESSLSRRHARFTWREEGVWVEDLDSTNGTFVGGRRIGRALVAPADEISLGSVVASLHMLDPESAVQPVVEEPVFESWLRGAVARARANGTSVALLMLHELGEQRSQMGSWLPRVRGQLRGTEQLGLYAPGWLVIGRENADDESALSFARACVAAGGEVGAELGCGVALAPEHESRAANLIGLVRELSDEARPASPVITPSSRSKEFSMRGLVIQSPRMRALYEHARRAAQSRMPVLIYGETGAGKELVARAVHESGVRAGKPLLTINCGSLPQTLAESVLFGHERGAFTGADRRHVGLFESADGGTVFLDEVGELPLATQASLLRAIEAQRVRRVGSSHETSVDVRILAATNRELDQMCKQGLFRSDLLFRLNAIELHVPPLRERADEIEPLALHFISALKRDGRPGPTGFSAQALQKLQRHSWPGNVRELRNVVERAVVLARGMRIEAEDVHVQPAPAASASTLRVPALPGEASLKDRVRAYEGELIVDALRHHGWNQTETARHLGLPIRTLAHKIKQLGLRARFPK